MPLSASGILLALKHLAVGVADVAAIAPVWWCGLRRVEGIRVVDGRAANATLLRVRRRSVVLVVDHRARGRGHLRRAPSPFCWCRTGRHRRS